MFAINNDTYDAHAPKYTTFASMLLGAIEVFGEPIVRTHTQINYKYNHSIDHRVCIGVAWKSCVTDKAWFMHSKMMCNVCCTGVYIYASAIGYIGCRNRIDTNYAHSDATTTIKTQQQRIVYCRTCTNSFSSLEIIYSLCIYLHLGGNHFTCTAALRCATLHGMAYFRFLWYLLWMHQSLKIPVFKI